METKNKGGKGEGRQSKIEEKRWDKVIEIPIARKWKDNKLYAFDRKSKKPVYSIDTPPPYVNTPVHIGQAATYVLMDMFARFRRMTGHNVLFPLGLDRNGLPIEMAAERKFGIKLGDVTRERFIKMCRSVLEESSSATEETFFRLGISFNSWKAGEEVGDIYHTDSPDYRSLTQDSFIDLWNKGLIYEDDRINNFCPGCGTTIADAEVIYRDLPSKFNDIIFRVKETGEKIIIGTTRPELICTCAMVIFNPKDDRYRSLEGKTAVTPVFGKEVPIKSHPYAEMDKGTGLMMMCSAGDLTDIRFFREMNLEPLIAIGSNGLMNEHAGFMKGLTVQQARGKMIEVLIEKKLLVKQKDTVHRTPVCERSKDPIEFISMKEFYLKQMDCKKKMLELAKKISFYSPRSRQIMIDWINSVSIDWPISRRRYYATEIPIWYCAKCKHPILPPKGEYYQPWKDKCPWETCPKCGHGEFYGEDRVFDTWFDSSMSPLYILKYSRDGEFFRRNSPCSLRPQGKEIIRTWLYYTVLKDYLLTGELIFRDAWINYHIVDDNGKKMSKSLGNIIDPQEVIKRFGAEPFRMWCAIEGNLENTDFRCSFDRIEGTHKTLTKIWNVARFVSMFPKPGKRPELEPADRWIMNEVNKLVKNARKCYEKYDFHTPAAEIKHFIWETFASNYIEMVKTRAYNENGDFSKQEQESACFALNHALETVLRLLAPVNPFLTYRLYEELTGKDIHFTEFPEPEKGPEKKMQFTTEELAELNSGIWKAKKDKGESLKSEIEKMEMPKKFREIGSDLRRMHNISKLSFV
ncbi:MAG: valine--tRNA ligase [Candidatus Aenigmarchaeota archaeon]|nr:valine--tRNA ligase [Candidatus Aenigmarchaeota archaeon]